MSKQEGEDRVVPVPKNDIKNQPASTGKPRDRTDSTGKTHEEFSDQNNAVKPKGNITIDVDDAQLDQTTDNQTTEIKR